MNRGTAIRTGAALAARVIGSPLAMVLLALLLASCAPARLVVYSRPGGAEVFVDETLVSRTVSEQDPVRVTVEPGAYRVAVEREGYEPWEREVVAGPGKEVAVTADLVAIVPPPYRPLGRIEVRTNPGGALVMFDGEEIGYTSMKEYKPIMIENLDPGRYKVVMDRHGYRPVARWVTVHPNQTTRVAADLESLPPYYQFPTDDDMKRQAVMKAIRGVPHMAGMGTKKTIAVVDLEGASRPLNALIEDVVIAELSYYGRRVAEREDHLLVRIANEAARGDSLMLDVLTRNMGPDRPFVYDARIQSSAEPVRLMIPEKDGTRREILVRSPPMAPAEVRTADQILGYRIVEDVLRIDASPSGDDEEPMLRREALVRLYFRLLDAKTGIVEWAERYEASVVDFVPERVYRYLRQPPDRLYAYAPTREEASETRPAEDPMLDLETVSEESAPSGADRDAIFWYHRNVGEAYHRAGRPREAEFHLREAVHLRPEDYDARMFLGQTLLNLGRIDAAREQYLAAMKALGAR